MGRYVEMVESSSLSLDFVSVQYSLLFPLHLGSLSFNIKSVIVLWYRRNIGLGIYSMHFGCLIFLWKEFKVMDTGLYFALMRLQVCQIVGVKNLRNCTTDMRER